MKLKEEDIDKVRKFKSAFAWKEAENEVVSLESIVLESFACWHSISCLSTY